MSEVQERHRASIDLAQRFYDDHKVAFDEAALKNSLDDQWFEITLAEFDRWLVAKGLLEEPADVFVSNTIQRYGVVQHRNGARTRINVAARKAADHPAYSISSRAAIGCVRVKLLELYARDAPADIAGGFKTSTAHYLRQVKRI